MELVPLTPDRLGDWLGFFDGPAFQDNPDWSTCYCRCYLFGARGLDVWNDTCATPGANRAAMIDRINDGTVDGLLALRDGAVVGWVQYGPTARFASPIAALEPADADSASIVCFVVAPEHRRTGVARALLRGAVAELRRRGFRNIDARAPAADADVADQFPGPLALYLAEGFVPIEAQGTRQLVRLTAAG